MFILKLVILVFVFFVLVSCALSGIGDAKEYNCEKGRTIVDGVCVKNEVADYISCVRARGGVLEKNQIEELSVGVSYILSANIGYSENKHHKSEFPDSENNISTIIRECGKISRKADREYIEQKMSNTFLGEKKNSGVVQDTTKRIVKNEIRLNATTEWQHTGLVFERGQFIRIFGKGTWTNGGSSPRYVDANGFVGYQHKGSINEYMNFASLLGRVSGKIFSIGAYFEGKLPRGGELYLSMNDVSGKFMDNVGAINIVIEK